MTYDDIDSEPGRHEFHGTPLGMNALVAAWHQRRAQQWAAAASAAQGYAVMRPGLRVTGRLDTTLDDIALTAHGAVTTPGTGAFGIEGGRPSVEGGLVKLPELLLPAAIVVTGDKVAEGQLIDAVGLAWFEIIEKVVRDPAFVHQLDWREVEQLIAGAYKREGWPEVILTPRSGDGGRDIIVSRPGVGAIRFYDQVKAYNEGHRVPADDVRALLGVLVVHQNVSKAIITTTARFAPGVEDEMKSLMPYRLELKDGPRLHQWLSGLSPVSPADSHRPKAT